MKHRIDQLLRAGRLPEVLEALRPQLSNPAPDADLLQLLVRLALMQRDLSLAHRALDVAFAFWPQNAGFHGLASAAAHIEGNDDLLESEARAALEIDFAQPLAATLLANLLSSQLRFAEATDIATRTLSKAPDDAGLRLARANASLFSGDACLAEADARHAFDHQRSLVAGQVACMSLLYMDRIDPAAIMDRHITLCRRVSPVLRDPIPARSRTDSRLRVGLLSPDFRTHPVGRLVVHLLQGLKAREVEVTCFSDAVPDDLTSRLRVASHSWRDCRNHSDVEVARQIRADGIDVLVDLSGHTHGSRPAVLATRCAPVQLGYLGYLFDTGFDTLDGVIGSQVMLPAGTSSARTPLRLPDIFMPLIADLNAPEVGPGGTHGVVFGSFNHLAKLSPATIALWSRALHAVPDSTIELCALGLDDAGTRERVLRRFNAHDIEDRRIVLRPPIFETRRFLAQYDGIDIALDPLPFNGGATTLQALWQGVPVLSFPQNTMASRMGASILGAAGLDGCVATTDEDFIAMAVRWAEDQDGRRHLRKSMRCRLRASRLMDDESHARGFAELLESVTRRA